MHLTNAGYFSTEVAGAFHQQFLEFNYHQHFMVI